MTQTTHAAPCPVCGRPAEPELLPFCSRRCANVDLGRWLTGQYVAPSEPEARLIDPAS